MPTARQLPTSPSLEHLRNEAKALLKTYRADDADAVSRFRAHPRSNDHTKGQMQLADAQHVLAGEYGFGTWREIKEFVESDLAVADTAVANGDVATLRRLLDDDLGWLGRRGNWHGLGHARWSRNADLLTYAAALGSIPLVDVLVDYGVQSQVDIPSVFYACFRTGQFGAADHLFDRCEVEAHHLQHHLYQLTEDLNAGGVRWLIDHGTNPDYRRAGIKWTPLQNCLHTYPCLNPNRQEITRILIDAGADHDDNALYDLLAGRLDRLSERLDTEAISRISGAPPLELARRSCGSGLTYP